MVGTHTLLCLLVCLVRGVWLDFIVLYLIYGLGFDTVVVLILMLLVIVGWLRAFVWDSCI